MDKLLPEFFKHEILVKMFHLQTKSYGFHKASDAYLATFRDLMDKFLEVYQGLDGRVNTKRIEISTGMATDRNIRKKLFKFIQVLNSQDIKHQALQVILDDMIVELARFVYLLDFQ